LVRRLALARPATTAIVADLSAIEPNLLLVTTVRTLDCGCRKVVGANQLAPIRAICTRTGRSKRPRRPPRQNYFARRNFVRDRVILRAGKNECCVRRRHMRDCVEKFERAIIHISSVFLRRRIFCCAWSAFHGVRISYAMR
jgi:hypothetical protein